MAGIRDATPQDLARVITVLARGRQAERDLLLALAHAVLTIGGDADACSAVRAALAKVGTP